MGNWGQLITLHRRPVSYENNPSVFLVLRSGATPQSSICVFCGL